MLSVDDTTIDRAARFDTSRVDESTSLTTLDEKHSALLNKLSALRCPNGDTLDTTERRPNRANQTTQDQHFLRLVTTGEHSRHLRRPLTVGHNKRQIVCDRRNFVHGPVGANLDVAARPVTHPWRQNLLHVGARVDVVPTRGCGENTPCAPTGPSWQGDAQRRASPAVANWARAKES